MKKHEILDAAEHIEFTSIYEAINACIGTEYRGWMKACWPNAKGNGEFRMWFPKLAKKKNGEYVAAAFDCLNTISADWGEVVFDDLLCRERSMDNKYRGLDLIFAKDPDGGYLFRGVYQWDETKSTLSHDVSKRVGTKVRLIGNPVSRIEIIE